MALDAAWEERSAIGWSSSWGTTSLAILLPQEIQGEELLSILEADRIE